MRTFLFLAAATFLASSARADVTAGQCIDANSSAQDARQSGRLEEARRQLVVCANEKCPAAVREDCIKRRDELEAAQPTIVFEVKDPGGADVTAVKVTMDAKPFLEKSDGTARRVDPGEHVFVLTAEGAAPETRKVVVAEGEKGRRERVVIGAASRVGVPAGPSAAPEAAGGAASGSHAEARSGGLGTSRTVGLTLGGVGVAGLVAGGVFGALAASAWSAQQRDCASATSCADRAQALSDHSTLTTDGAVSTAAFLGGGVLVAVGAVLFLTGGRGGGERAAVVVAPSASGEGAGVVVRGSF